MSLLAKALNGRSRLAAHWRRSAARSRGVTFRGDAWIGSRVEFRFSQPPELRKELTIGRGARIDTGCVLDAFGGSIALGDNVYVGPYSTIYGHGSVTIGDDTLIASHCRILSSNHDIGHGERRIRDLPDVCEPTSIGPNCWLGTGVVVLAGVAIGANSVIGAGSLVTRDIPSNAVAFGTPARVHSTREGSPAQSEGLRQGDAT